METREYPAKKDIFRPALPRGRRFSPRGRAAIKYKLSRK